MSSYRDTADVRMRPTATSICKAAFPLFARASRWTTLASAVSSRGGSIADARFWSLGRTTTSCKVSRHLQARGR